MSVHPLAPRPYALDKHSGQVAEAGGVHMRRTISCKFALPPCTEKPAKDPRPARGPQKFPVRDRLHPAWNKLAERLRPLIDGLLVSTREKPFNASSIAALQSALVTTARATLKPSSSIRSNARRQFAQCHIPPEVALLYQQARELCNEARHLSAAARGTDAGLHLHRQAGKLSKRARLPATSLRSCARPSAERPPQEGPFVLLSDA